MNKLQKQLEALRKQREAAIKKMEGVYATAEQEERTFDASEQEDFDSAKAEVSSLDQQIKNVEDLMVLQASRAVPVSADPATPQQPGGSRQGGAIQVARNLPKGTAFTRFAICMIAAKGNLMQASELARQHYAKDTPEVETVLRAAVAAGTTTGADWARPLVEYTNMASEFIELLRPYTILGRISGFRNVPFNIRMARQTAGTSAGWVGEGQLKPVGKLSFDTVSLPFSKVAIIVAITEELAKFSNPSAEAAVRNDMLEGTATFLDTQFIDPTVAGLAGVSPASITNGLTPVTVPAPLAAATVADLTTLVQKMLTNMVTAKIPMRAPVWIMNSALRIHIAMMRTQLDQPAFPSVTANGTFFGYPIVDSQSVPLGAETPLILADASEIFMADEGGISIDISREASLAMDTAKPLELTSLWQNNLIGLKAERYIHWMRRREEAVQIANVPLQ